MKDILIFSGIVALTTFCCIMFPITAISFAFLNIKLFIWIPAIARISVVFGIFSMVFLTFCKIWRKYT